MLDAKLLAPAVDTALETLLNSAIRYDQYGAPCLKPLVGKSVGVTFSDLNLTFYFIIQPDQLAINRTLEGEADAQLTTRSLLWPLLKQPDTRAQLLQQQRVTFAGDRTLAEGFLDCLGQLHPELGAVIERWLGTLPASLFTQAEQQAHRLLRRLSDSGRLTLQEYLQFEVALLPTREEYTVFARQVAQTHGQVEQLSARIQRLEHATDE
ncbi:MAG TPA: hypothetical protein EYP05_01720 [Piscirickettsiaceae bacterium]|nr:hypothetical protein [Piscirickettsiaceae bacterium]